MNKADLFLQQIKVNETLQNKFKEDPSKVLKNLGLKIIRINDKEECDKDERN